MHLDHLVHVDAGHPQATSTLMTSSSRGGDVRSGGVRSQAASSSSPPAVIRKPFCGPVLAGVVGLDEPVPLEPLQGRVHLADVQRPDLAGPRLELLAELEAVLRALAQQREQGVPHAHDGMQLGIILSIVPAMRYRRKP